VVRRITDQRRQFLKPGRVFLLQQRHRPFDRDAIAADLVGQAAPAGRKPAARAACAIGIEHHVLAGDAAPGSSACSRYR
jgi:hypothetical protein